MTKKLLGHVRSGLNFNLGAVYLEAADAPFKQQLMLYYEGGYLGEFLGYAQDEKDARQLLGERRREATRVFRRWSTSTKKLNHGPGPTFRE